MNVYAICLSLFLYIYTVECQSYRPSALEAYLSTYRGFRNGWLKAMGRSSENAVHMKKARELGIIQTHFPSSYPFPCNVTGFRSLKPPANVNRVRPGDIDIVAALGDSLTAGSGIIAMNLFEILQENRGLVWSIGGQSTWREFTTLPNILKEFNPNLFGFSTRDSITTDRESQFNPAEAAALSSELPYMAQVLVKRIKSDPRVNLKQHWKLITTMIGANDFCFDICFQNDLQLVLQQHRDDLIAVLRFLRDHLPRTIVNLCPPPNVKLLRTIKGNSTCESIHYLECTCFFAKHLENKLGTFYNLIEQWHLIDEEIASMEEFQTNDFSVIFQPFILEAKIPMISENLTDFTNLSTDCFHLTQKLQARAATSIWNNMMEKIGNKSKTISPLMDLICPTHEHPYIFTPQNSIT